MPAKADLWFIRLPDGRVLRARSTNVLRRHLKSGRIPWDSRIRHSTQEPWQRLDNADEFTDLLPKNGDAPTMELPPTTTMPRRSTVRAVLDELLTACDSSLQGTKLIAAGCTGLGIGIAFMVADAIARLLPDGTWLVFAGAGFVSVILFSACSSILTQMTALELSRFRRARFSEVRSGLLGAIVRLTVALGLSSGAIVGLMLALRWLAEDIALPDTALAALTAGRAIVEVGCWLLLGLVLLVLPPVLLIEEDSIIAGLRDWLTFVWRHLGRIYLYQAFAFALAAILALPLVASVLLTSFLTDSPYAFTMGCLLGGIAVTPVFAYLVVAQVFIYLNLRYEFLYSSRQR
ncbi:MAG TPA: hypothetical protein VFE62_22835 [Gemmataceae bacterium]|nr:hypothetical protein [Gemmataceae bacterium]